jgi:hypothetical protein
MGDSWGLRDPWAPNTNAGACLPASTCSSLAISAFAECSVLCYVYLLQFGVLRWVVVVVVVVLLSVLLLLLSVAVVVFLQLVTFSCWFPVVYP